LVSVLSEFPRKEHEEELLPVLLSSELLRAMGFRPLEAGESISASFVSLFVYEVRGITLQSIAPKIIAAALGSASIRLGVGDDLNDTCLAVAGDTYVEDEATWRKERGASGPFLIIQLGLPQVYTITEGWISTEPDGSATLYDSIPALRTDLAEIEAMALPPLVTSLTCQLAAHVRHVNLHRLERTSSGRTASGQIVRDNRITASAQGRVSHPIPPDAVSDCLEGAVALAPRLDARSAHFFALGTAEEDELKKFLYSFLALEVETHTVFKQINHAQALRALFDSESSPRPAAIALLQRQVDQLRTLLDRFVWCATFVWTGVTEEDVAEFRAFKKTRDQIAHGEIDVPPGGAARLVQQLACKVLRNRLQGM
jgi:hypothetical protein